MRKKLGQKGVTIVEVMIVLAIISLAFTISLKVFQPFINKESFRQSVNLFTVEINATLNDIREGVHPGPEGVRCFNASGTLNFATDPDAKPGNNNDCIILGKALQLGVSDPGTENVTEINDNYMVHTLIGLVEDNKDSSRRGSFKKVQIFRDIINAPPVFKDTSVSEVIPHGGFIDRVYYDEDGDGDFNEGAPNLRTAGAAVYLDGLAVVLSTFGEQTSTNSDFLGSSRNIELRAIYRKDVDIWDSSRGRLNDAGFVRLTSIHDPANSTPVTTYHQISQPIIICMNSDQGQRAFIRVGNNNGVLSAVADLDAKRADAACNPVHF